MYNASIAAGKYPGESYLWRITRCFGASIFLVTLSFKSESLAFARHKPINFWLGCWNIIRSFQILLILRISLLFFTHIYPKSVQAGQGTTTPSQSFPTLLRFEYGRCDLHRNRQTVLFLFSLVVNKPFYECSPWQFKLSTEFQPSSRGFPQKLGDGPY